MPHDFDASAALLEQVNHALDSATPLRIQGSGSKAHLGRATTGEVLDTRLHRGIVSYDPTELVLTCLLYTSPSPRDVEESRMPSSA